MPDMIEEMNKEGTGGQPSNTGLPTPKEMEEAEKAELARIAGETEKNTNNVTAGDDGNQNLVTPEMVEAIRNKITNGEELDENEANIIANLDQLLEEPAPQTIKVGDKTYSLAEAEQAAREHYNLGAVKLSKKAVAKFVNDWKEINNRKEVNRSQNRTYQTNAQDRKANIEMAMRNQAEKQRLDTERTSLKRLRETLTRQAEAINVKLKTEIKQEDVYDENQRIIPDKFAAMIDQTNSRTQLAQITTEIKALEEQENIAIEASVMNEINMFVADNPQYQTTETLSSLMQKTEQGIPVNAEDEIKLMEIRSIMKESFREKKSPQKILEYRKRSNTLAVKPSAQPEITDDEERTDLTIPTQGELLAKKLKLLEEKTRKAPASIGVGSSREQRTTQVSTSRNMVEEGRQLMGKTSTPFLKELGYS